MLQRMLLLNHDGRHDGWAGQRRTVDDRKWVEGLVVSGIGSRGDRVEHRSHPLGVLATRG
jgi:hypothetical protein